MRYRHTQFGLVITAMLGAALLGCAVGAVLTGETALLVAVVLFSLLIWQMSSLTTVVDEHAFECWFGPGMIRRRIPLADIEDVAVVRYAWLYGWGIRLTHRGWLWNVSGLRAVRLRLNGGRHFSVGSDEPEMLAAAIDAQRQLVRPSP